MKKTQTWIVGALAAVALISSSLYSPKANAYAFVSMMGHGYVVSATGRDSSDAILCVALFPFCLLKDKAAPGHLTAKDLLANSYSQAEVNSILAGQSAAVKYFTEKNMRVTEGNELSSDQLAERLADVPGATPEFIEFVRSN